MKFFTKVFTSAREQVCIRESEGKFTSLLPALFLILMFDGSSIGTEHYLRVFRVLSSSSVEENVKYKITMVLS